MADKTITVVSKRPEGEVALWEINELHPKGEVYIADHRPVEVGETTEVKKRLRDGILAEVKEEKKAASAPAKSAAKSSKAAAPWLGYDDASEESIVERLGAANADERAKALAYEQEGQKRQAVIDAASAKN